MAKYSRQGGVTYRVDIEHASHATEEVYHDPSLCSDSVDFSFVW